MATQHQNPAFIGDDGETPNDTNTQTTPAIKVKPAKERDTWGKGIEFLLSCIAMSVGLGNVWRFPFTALENGGGAFLIPYLIVLFLIGKPIYYLEMIIGQFSSRGSVKVYDFCPAMRGIGIGQVYMVSLLFTYYTSIVALVAYYLVVSFWDPLPWANCRLEWGENCIDASPKAWLLRYLKMNNFSMSNFNLTRTERTRMISSSEFYFVKEVLREKDSINDGIGLPNWELVLGLIIAWICIYLVIIRGVKSSGKASYFLAIFPYVIMGILLIRAVTLPGSIDGIIYFIKPNWGKILDPKVWYAAVTQCFYSLSVCFGNIIMYASYNKFTHNVHRDAIIVTSLDTCTSLLSGFTIFGILGNLAHEIGTTDIGSVVKGGTGLAFISYPDAISKFKNVPQIFAVLFFLMLFILGIGSIIAMTSCTVTSIRDHFPKIKQWQCALGIAIISFIIGLAYVTPGGQFILTLVDYFGASMVALVLGIIELYVLGWVYGVDRLCKDAEFMMNRKIGLYWRICWAVVTPLIMTMILIYFYATYTQLTYNDVPYPTWAYALGWTITSLGVLQVPIWMCVAIIRDPGTTLAEKIRGAFSPKPNWGPSDPLLREQYKKERDNDSFITKDSSIYGTIKKNICG
ncbi:sodium-dependent nutrient amino acid transporter 1-like isoform X1 [Teleopsis dalmanni]|uniref:sodium-dependent nutrient amino acid transporter 1-like isoform X1 n=1 Tax=Teleopsis dalmanni TaxID=139649 RepID=UPI0018CF7E87|nr:sodium-dependent nutrient amino acid transporter 1-like isoform X1 [Teleopsis dalmanni]